MREAELWQRLRTQVGDSYAKTWAENIVLAELHGCTVTEALASGIPCKEIWRAVRTFLQHDDARD